MVISSKRGDTDFCLNCGGKICPGDTYWPFKDDIVCDACKKDLDKCSNVVWDDHSRKMKEKVTPCPNDTGEVPTNLAQNVIKVILTHGCCDCPFTEVKAGTGFVDSHYYWACRLLKKYGALDSEYIMTSGKIPKKCPLREGSIAVKLFEMA